MKVGDLVMLSSYGKLRNYNTRITIRNPNEVGLIVKISNKTAYPYKVEWMGGDNYDCGHMRRELKYAYR